MTERHSMQKYLFLISIILFSLLLVVEPALAQGITFGSDVPKGKVIDHNLILTGNNVTIDGTVNGDVLAFGDTITLNGVVNGALVIGGRKALVNGTADGNVYTAVVQLQLDPQADIQRDLFFLGQQLLTQTGSKVGRDLFAMSLGAQLAGEVGRDVKAVIGLLEILQKAFDAFGIKANLPVIGSAMQPVAFGNPIQLSPMFGLASFSALANYSQESVFLTQGAAVNSAGLQTWSLQFLRNLIVFLLLGLLAAWLAPTAMNLASWNLQKSPWLALGYGLVVFVVGWFLALLLFIIFAALAVFFFWVTLPTLGFIVVGIGLLGLGLAITLFWFFIAFISKLVVAYLIGNIVLRRLMPKADIYRIWPMVLGVVLYVLLASIPYLGWVVAALVTFFGLGALWMSFRPGHKLLPTAEPAILAEMEPTEGEPEAQPDVETENAAPILMHTAQSNKSIR